MTEFFEIITIFETDGESYDDVFSDLNIEIEIDLNVDDLDFDFVELTF